jgi:hypothetical protein
MTIGSGVVNAYGSTQSDDVLQTRVDVTRQVGQSLDPLSQGIPSMIQMDQSRIGFNLNQALNKPQSYYLN